MASAHLVIPTDCMMGQEVECTNRGQRPNLHRLRIPKLDTESNDRVAGENRARPPPRITSSDPVTSFKRRPDARSVSMMANLVSTVWIPPKPLRNPRVA